MRAVLLGVQVVVWWLWVLGEMTKGMMWVAELALALVLPPG